jgi:hypothetical protein
VSERDRAAARAGGVKCMARQKFRKYVVTVSVQKMLICAVKARDEKEARRLVPEKWGAGLFEEDAIRVKDDEYEIESIEEINDDEDANELE